MNIQPNPNEASLHAVDYWQVIKNRYGVILMTLLLVFMTAAVITYVMPRKYESVAVVQVKPPYRLGGEVFSNNSAFSPVTQSFFNTEFEVIRQQLTLKGVVKDLDLQAHWGMSEEECIDNLQGIINTENYRGTDLIEIKVRHIAPDDARDVARSVYNAYKKRRMEKEIAEADLSLKELENAVQAQNDEVTEKRKQRDNFLSRAPRVIVDINGLTGGSNVESLVNDIERQVELARNKLNEIENYIRTIAPLQSEQLLRSVANLPNAPPELRSLYSQYQDEIRLLKTLETNGYGKKHPTYKSKSADVESIYAQLLKDTTSFKDSLQITRDTAQSDHDTIKARLEELRQAQREDVMQINDYLNSERDLAAQQLILDKLKEKLNTSRIDWRRPQTIIELHQEPRLPQVPSSPNVTLNLVIGAVIGIIFGIGIAFFLEYLDTSVKSLEDVERYLQVPVLAVIPKDVGILHKQSGMSPDSEAYRILRTNIEFNRKNPEDNSLTVVSGGAGEGKSTTLVNLAYICAQGGYTTLMIDADLRRPRLHTFFGINNSVGLTNYLTTELVLEDVILQTPVDNLFFMPSGILPADAAGILNSRRMSELIQDVKQRFDLVLVDSPPILGVSDASVLASEVDLTMIVVQHRKLPRNMLMRVKQSVENVGGHVIGVVLNNVDVRSDSQYQYYTSYYTYYAPAETQMSGNQSQPSVSTAPTNSSNKPTAASSKQNTDDTLY